MKICLVGAELFHVDGQLDGQTDMTKLRVAVRNFVNAPKNSHRNYTICFLLHIEARNLFYVYT
jgi:hypothetical protein